jgi:flagellar hook-basal body complex protein FliE
MTNGINNLGPSIVGKSAGASGAGQTETGQAGGSSFADTFSQYLNEVNQLQRDASQAVQANLTGQSDDMAGVMVAMEKSDVAFKTLVAIRSKLMSAYEELRNMPI